MARSTNYFSPPATLKPVKVDTFQHVIAEGNPTKPRWWRVNVGRRFTGTSKIRRYFATEKEAKEYILDVQEAARRRGHFAFSIPTALAVEAIELAKQLEPHKVPSPRR